MAGQFHTIETNVHSYRLLYSLLWSEGDRPEISDEGERRLIESRGRAVSLGWVLVIAWRVHRGRLQVTMKRAGFAVDVNNLWWMDAWRMWHTPIIANYMMRPENLSMCRRLHELLRDGSVTRNVKSYVVQYDH